MNEWVKVLLPIGRDGGYRDHQLFFAAILCPD